MERAYTLNGQIGFMLRKAHQRHVNIFATHIHEDVTPTQFAVLARLYEVGACSQNSLGRQTAMDVATIKGVVSRLEQRGLVVKRASEDDKRKKLIDLTPEGQRTFERAMIAATEISRMTLAPLSKEEQTQLLRLLRKIL